MKNITRAAALLLLAMQSLFVKAQTDSIDISTGLTSSGVLHNNLDPDTYWTVQRPGEGFSQILVGTGFEALMNINYPNEFYDINATPFFPLRSRMIIPYPILPSLDDDCYYSPFNVPGDIRHLSALAQGPYCFTSWDEPLGRYYFKRKVDLNVPTCEKISDAYFRVRILTGFDQVDQIFVNGHPITVTSYNPYPASVNPLEAIAHGYQEYLIPVNPAWLTPGPDNTITVTVNKWYTSSGTGFMFDGWLVYKVASGGSPAVSFAGTTQFVCPGSSAHVTVKVTNTGSGTYSATLKGKVAGVFSNIASTTLTGQTPYTFPTMTVNATEYKVQVTSTSVSGCTAEYKVPMNICKNASFTTSINYTGGHLVIQATPTNPDETALTGFKQKWTLEDLEPAGLEPLFVVETPTCWELGAGEVQRFDGFLPADKAYQEEYAANGSIDIDCNAGAGEFLPYHTYRLTRYVKDDHNDWDSYSTIIRTGANPEFTYNTASVGGGGYNVEALPVSQEQEAATEGFEQKWKIERYTPGNTLMYSIDGPSCWNGAAGTATVFEGFDGVNSNYEADYASGPISIVCASASDGVFMENDAYTVTRYVKGDLYDWTSYTATVISSAFTGKPVSQQASGNSTKQHNNTSLKESAPELALAIYPNPAKGRFMLKTSGTGVINVFDMLGKNIRQISVKEGQQEYMVDLSGMAKGIYTVSVVVDGKAVSQKVVME